MSSLNFSLFLSPSWLSPRLKERSLALMRAESSNPVAIMWMFISWHQPPSENSRLYMRATSSQSSDGNVFWEVEEFGFNPNMNYVALHEGKNNKSINLRTAATRSLSLLTHLFSMNWLIGLNNSMSHKQCWVMHY